MVVLTWNKVFSLFGQLQNLLASQHLQQHLNNLKRYIVPFTHHSRRQQDMLPLRVAKKSPPYSCLMLLKSSWAREGLTAQALL